MARREVIDLQHHDYREQSISGQSQSNEYTSLLSNAIDQKPVASNSQRFKSLNFESPKVETTTFDNIKRWKSVLLFIFSVVSSILFIAIVFYYFKLREDHHKSLLASPPKLPPLSIYTTRKDGEDLVYVIDNYPLPTLPSLKETNKNGENQLKGSSISVDKDVLAEGRYVRNVNNNGWHYLSIKAADLGVYKPRRKMESGRHSKNEDEIDKIYIFSTIRRNICEPWRHWDT
mmetsp:Transcript_4556/g.6235  ORF Transcript_4556/g.6235 Transcript_4556/m.6235 type:complete len:231 (+) Transcript_4556:121-813(+)